ncbi:GGDEF domain-containing protein, partial [Erythrobacter sp. HI0063]|uniref:GGDEF domain-containing protein n=1 Tax=Erythrobacter sp. HI0063 TaxID=1822240 RepID=UPI000AACF9E3
MPTQTEKPSRTPGSGTFRDDAVHDGTRSRSKREIVSLGVALAAVTLFAAIGGTVIPQLLSAWRGLTDAPDKALASAMLLNIAIILIGWRRYNTVSNELKNRTLSEAEARREALLDPLTGCHNRRSIAPAMSDLHRRAETQDRRVAVVLVDLDGFKQINDVHGHAFGDDVLRQAAQRMRDLLPADALLARIGGDEFAIALSHDRSANQDVERLVSLLIEAVAKPIVRDDIAIATSMSVGIVGCRDVAPGLSMDEWPNEMMHKADIAMYHAKKHGKNRYVWFEP